MRWRKENTMQVARFIPSRSVALVSVLLIVALIAAAWLGLQPQTPIAEDASASAEFSQAPKLALAAASGPPWRYGRDDARFTVVEYADLECPFCRAYFPALKQWIDAHPEVNWHWHHLPLAPHEPAATANARLVECVGEAGGSAAFWRAVEWVYAHTRGDGQGLPEGLGYPGITPAAQQCLDSDRPDTLIRAQSAAAAWPGGRRCAAVGHRPAGGRRHHRHCIEGNACRVPRRHAQVAPDLQGYAAALAALIDPVRLASFDANSRRAAVADARSSIACCSSHAGRPRPQGRHGVPHLLWRLPCNPRLMLLMV
jgi:hypothetical protein